MAARSPFDHLTHRSIAMSKPLKNKLALVTGSSRGIGAAIAIRLAAEGASVIVNYAASPKRAEEVVAQIKKEGGEAEAVQADLGSPDGPKTLMASVDKVFGGKFAGRLDILVNNAAIGISGPMTEIPMELLRRSFETNFFAPLALTQKIVRKLVDENRQGKVVFISSIGGLMAVPYGGPYATTKHALEALAGSMKAELAPFGIQVQVINPGGYLTGFNESEAESATHWMDDRKNYIKRDTVQNFFHQILGTDDNRMDPQLMADAMVKIIPEDAGLFRNVVPKATEDLARNIQRELWNEKIEIPR